MEAHFKTRDGRLTFKLEGDTPKALFAAIASVQEIFEADTECGLCHDKAIRFRVRQVDDFSYYEMVCTNPTCRARLSFGQNRVGGGLFAKRKGAEGNWLENDGWEQYRGTGGGTE